MQYSYVTLLSSNDYLQGILALYQGLKRVKSKYPLAVCVTEDISEEVIEVLNKLQVQIIYIQKFEYLDGVQQKYILCGKKYLNNAASKFSVYGLDCFDKIVLLDCDMCIIENVDDLFERPSGSSVPLWGYGGLSGGTIVLEPSKKLLERLLFLHNKFHVDEELCLNLYFEKWNQRKELHLPIEYNAWFNYSNVFFPMKPKIIHFIGINKPFINNINYDIESLTSRQKQYIELFRNDIYQCCEENNIPLRVIM